VSLLTLASAPAGAAGGQSPGSAAPPQGARGGRPIEECGCGKTKARAVTAQRNGR